MLVRTDIVTRLIKSKLESFTAELTISTNEAFAKFERVIGTSKLAVKASVLGSSMLAEGGRDFSWPVVVVAILVFWPAAILYYLTLKRNRVSVNLSPKETGCTISISSRGRKGDDVLRLLKVVAEQYSAAR